MFFTLMIKGFIIGISFTIPGCSGGTFAVYVGIYDQLLHALGNIFKEFRKSMTFLIPIGIGLASGIMLFSKLMALALEANSFITIMFFIGMTLGGVPNLFKNVKGKKVSASGIVSFITAFAIVVIMLVFQVIKGTNGISRFTIDFETIALLFGLGFIAAITMIIPGVSGSALLMILGFYTAIVSNVVGNLLDYGDFWYNIAVIIPFGLGAVTGVILISKVLETILRRFPVQSYMAIIGFVIASAAILVFWIRIPEIGVGYVDQTPIYLNFWNYVSSNLVSVFVGFAALAIGLVAALGIVRFGSKRYEKV